MPQSKYINVSIDGRQLDLKSIKDIPLSISYKLEDSEDFQTKKSSESFNVVIPATVKNDQIANTFHNPGVEDITPGQHFRNFRQAIIEANGIEILTGKCLLTNAGHNGRPLDYEFQFFGTNADWMIDLKEKTLFDFLNHITFPYTKQNIIDSWLFDGTNEALPYVFAPVRYGQAMEGGYTNLVMNPPPFADDWNMLPTYMKPSISKYWLLFWGFKSLGYRIASDFFNTNYFRRQVMPWTWGSFNFSSGTRLDNLDFLAKSAREVSMINQDITTFWDLLVSNDSTNGAFDNNGVYEYDAVNKEMKWTYLPAFDYDTIETTFRLEMFVRAVATANSDVELRVQWFKNGVKQDNGNDNGNGTLLMELHAGNIVDPPSRVDFNDTVEDWFSTTVDPTDVISAKIYLHTFDSGTGIARIHATVNSFELDFIRIPLGGTIDFSIYDSLKKHKFLDFVRGVIDEFNLTVATDSISKIVYIEPTHPYSLEDDLSEKSGGYFNEDFIDWEEKQDLSKRSDLPLFSDSERELLFKYKDDGNDGILKKVQDRFTNILAAGKYVFPDRFKAGRKEIENRFFSPVMHYDVVQWKNLGTVADEAPQMICMIPENISNTSRDEAGNTFAPKSAYYKGLTTDVGWVFDSEKTHPYPFMFACNYKDNGQEDPILSYSDERIGKHPDFVIGKGLLKRFYWQRLAVMRNGQYYETSFLLRNIDVANLLHREHIVCRGQRWELVEINDFKPLLEETTACFMRKWSPVTEGDADNTYPSNDNVLETGLATNAFDLKYARLICLASDIPAITQP